MPHSLPPIALAILELGTKILVYNNLLLFAHDYCLHTIDCFFGWQNVSFFFKLKFSIQ